MSSGTTLADLVSNLKALGVLLILFILVFAGGYLLSNCQSRSKYDLLLGETNSTIEELSIERNRTRTLDKVLQERGEEAEGLKEIIRSYENRPEEIRYIVKTETVVVGREEHTVELPPSHLFTFENGLPVSEFRQIEEGYSFKTFDIVFNTTVVISEDQTAVLLEATSSYDELTYKIPINSTEVTKIRETKFFEPQIMLGFTGSVSINCCNKPASGDLLISLSMPLLHPLEELDILIPRVSANSTTYKFGGDAFMYNLGKEIPIVTDFWVGVGITGKIGSSYLSIDLTVGSKF
jgi:hypothetical protein